MRLSKKINDKQTWIHFDSVQKEDFKEINILLNLKENHLEEYIFDENEKMRLMEFDNLLIFILELPLKFDTGYETTSFNILYSNEYIITLTNHESQFIQRKMESTLSTNTRHILLELYDKMIDQFIIALNDISKEIDIMHKHIKDSHHESKILKVLNLEKSMIYFSTSITSNELILSKYKRMNKNNFDAFEHELLTDIEIEIKQGLEMIKVYSQILNSITKTMDSLSANRLAKVMQFLTALTLIITIPTLYASIYGMNIPLPLQDNPNAFWIFCIFSLITIIVISLYFYFKKYF